MNNPLPEAYAHLPRMHFGNSAAMANDLCDLVLNGRKTATCSALCEYQSELVALPQIGERNVIVDGTDAPRCVIEYTAVDITAFDDVAADFAFAEGEGDRSHGFWRRTHRSFFESQGYFADDMALVCKRFRLIEVLKLSERRS